MNTIAPSHKSLLTVFGLGALRPAPGTWGSILPVVAAGASVAVVGVGSTGGRALYGVVLGLIALVFGAACVLWGHEAQAHWRRPDPSHVVADEAAGQCVTLLMIPSVMLTGFWSSLVTLVGAFLLFRGFDILKPWPAGAVERVAGGWGVLLDDLVAGLMGGVVIWIVHVAQ